MNFENAKKKLENYEQLHVLKYYDELPENEKKHYYSKSMKQIFLSPKKSLKKQAMIKEVLLPL